MTDWKRVGRLFQRAREDAGIDQDRAAAEVGKTGPGARVTMSRWENGKSRIPLDAAIKLARLYGQSLADLGFPSSDEVAEDQSSDPRSGNATNEAPAELGRIISRVREAATFYNMRRRMGASDAELERLRDELRVVVRNGLKAGADDPDGAATLAEAFVALMTSESTPPRPSEQKGKGAEQSKKRRA